MNIPDKDFTVKIGPFVYEVIYSVHVAHESDSFGSTHNNDQRIFLDPTRPPQMQLQTFLHEVFHAMFFVSSLTYRNKDKHTEEEVCQEISMILQQVMQDNPEIFKG